VNDFRKSTIELVRSVQPLSWILLVALLFAIVDIRSKQRAFDAVCGLAEEAIDITTPQPADPQIMLRTIEIPSRSEGYAERALWRWQQIDGEQIDKACNAEPGETEPNS
jgi:hypothetical protein